MPRLVSLPAPPLPQTRSTLTAYSTYPPSTAAPVNPLDLQSLITETLPHLQHLPRIHAALTSYIHMRNWYYEAHIIEDVANLLHTASHQLSVQADVSYWLPLFSTPEEGADLAVDLANSRLYALSLVNKILDMINRVSY